MKLYIKNILPKLKEFSLTLDKKEFFVNIPWVILDEKLNQQKYIFKGNGDLIMSLNGQVTIGSWEYLSSAKSILIDRIQDKILLNQNFVDPGVMILKKDGVKDDFFVMANELIIPDLDVTKYLKKIYYKKNNISVLVLTDGQLLEIHNYTHEFALNKVAINGSPVPDGLFEGKSSNRILIVKNSKIFKVLSSEKFKSNKGNIVIQKQQYCNPAIGDLVFKDNAVAPDGKYRLGLFNNIIVKGGKIV